MFHTVQETESVARFDIWERQGRLAAVEMVFSGRELRERSLSAIPWIKQAAVSFTSILRQRGFIGDASAAAIQTSAEAIIADMRRNKDIDADELTAEDLGDFANPDGSLRLLTLHSAKGREFDAVCIVELQEGHFPHPRGDPEESRRVLYVGVTRPRKCLLLCHRRGKTPARFLRETAFVQALRAT
jgi:DNA helicase-2/ATP-dependent DNA helicase PcrA